MEVILIIRAQCVNTEDGKIFPTIVTVVQGRGERPYGDLHCSAEGTAWGSQKYLICPPSSLNIEHLYDKQRDTDNRHNKKIISSHTRRH